MSIFNYRKESTYFQRLKEALKTTKEDLGRKVDEMMGTTESPITEDQLEDLEAILISADIGVRTTSSITEKIRDNTRRDRYLTSSQVRRLIRDELLSIIRSAEVPPSSFSEVRPQVVLIVGVNGVGKTTTIGKLAHRFKRDGHHVLLCAGDTFRAAAVEQLGIWAGRVGVDFVRQSSGADPAAVLFDALAAGKSRGADVVLVDTAGRLHTKANLMQELEKMKRVASREVEGAPHDVLLILDATTGQNALVQAREFQRVSDLTGVVVTKLDGTAKGGIVVAIVQELNLPVRYIGIGEKVEDLLPFSAEEFVESLVGAVD